METQEGVQETPTKMIKGLKHLPYEKRLRVPQLFNGRRKVQWDLLSVDLTGVKKTEPNTFQWCPIAEQEAKIMDTYYLNNIKNFY